MTPYPQNLPLVVRIDEGLLDDAHLLGVLLGAELVLARQYEVLAPGSLGRQSLTVAGGQDPAGGQQSAAAHVARLDAAFLVEPVQRHLPRVPALLGVLAAHDARRSLGQQGQLRLRAWRSGGRLGLLLRVSLGSGEENITAIPIRGTFN